MLVSTAGPGVPVVVVLVFSRKADRPVAAGLAGVGALPLRSRAMVACNWWCRDSVVASGVKGCRVLVGLHRHSVARRTRVGMMTLVELRPHGKSRGFLQMRANQETDAFMSHNMTV